ncbi:single-stranded DNA-binding protein [Bifidobacterium sp. ESL0764]|uniref:single-stranded DNA-binding protein n=1 Tax=Bifidobacterium sp. ESL0764 TaxID=2983228 RepID=UPI0023F9F8A3|nr:single-stranded DNA-binding protein [Bifidobacterium sp. ESL0764]WEV65320.1 single-stranded DNA-binding protein [Bifidobacterium sp. ESL0764]
MTQQGTVTISGFMGANPQSFGKAGGPAAVSFRIGCTTRYFNPAVNEWRDRPTTWITVKVFRQLAENVLSSLKKGDPVIATGNLATEEWTRDGTRHSKMVMEATSVGHDLSFGISVFQRVKPGTKEQGNGHDPFNAEQERAEDAAAEGGESQAHVPAENQNRASGEGGNTEAGSGPTANHAQHDEHAADDETDDESWDATEVFEGHETADRLVASVG